MATLQELAHQKLDSPKKFFEKLFEIRNVAHLTHIAQPDGTLATHLALGELYEAMTPIIDGLVEGWQGLMNNLLVMRQSGVVVEDPLAYLEANYEYISMHRSTLTESWMQNEIDEIIKCLAVTIYKLKYVK